MSDEKNFDPKKFSDDIHDQVHSNDCDEKQGRRRRPMVVGIALRGRGRGGIITGSFLILIGFAFLLDHLGIISMGHIWRFWPLLVVFAGAVNLTSRDRQAWGVFLIGAGTLEQLNELGITHIGWSQFWPLMVMALGLFVMWGSFRSSKSVASPSKGGDPRTTLNEAVVFGGLERRMTSPDFQGGDITAIFGGIELDLTEANMQANEATLAITAIFGGVEVRVPPTWQVAFRGAPIFGGIEDKTRTARVDDPASSNLKTLVITGAVIFGGLEIKN